MAKKARALVTGDIACENAVLRTRAKLLILANDASERTLRKFTGYAQTNKIPILHTCSKNDVGKALGTRPVAVVCVTNESFAKGFVKATKDEVTYDKIDVNIYTTRKDTSLKKGHGGDI